MLRSIPHMDLNLLTILPGAVAPGLQVADLYGWRDVPSHPARAIVLAGRELSQATRDIPATVHRVRNPMPGEDAPRLSVAYFASATLVRRNPA
jgi:isopenicillin N synthase-like dioxygenase